MADNVDITPGTGATVATDNIAGANYQRIKLTMGADGVNEGDVGSANPIPISAASIPTHAVTQSGVWTVQPGNTANTTAWKVDGSAVTQPVSLTSTTVTGTTDVNNKQINGVTPLMGNGVTGTGSQRVTIASDNTAFPVNAAVTAASGSVASGAFASGSIASGAIVDGAMATIGAKADAKNSATDTTAVSAISLLKQISYQLQQEQPVIIDKFSHYEDVLTANTVKTVDIDTSGYTAVYEIEITNKSSAGTIFFSVGTSSATPTDPATTTGSTQVGGFLPAAITSITLPNNTVAASLRVKLLSATASQPFCITVRGH